MPDLPDTPGLSGVLLARCGHPYITRAEDSSIPEPGRTGHCGNMMCQNYIGYCVAHPGGFPMKPEQDCRTEQFRAQFRRGQGGWYERSSS